MSDKALTMRLPADIYAEVSRLKKKSISQFVLDAVREKIERERNEEWAKGFAMLGADDVEEAMPFIQAQRKAMERNVD